MFHLNQQKGRFSGYQRAVIIQTIRVLGTYSTSVVMGAISGLCYHYCNCLDPFDQALQDPGPRTNFFLGVGGYLAGPIITLQVGCYHEQPYSTESLKL